MRKQHEQGLDYLNVLLCSTSKMPRTKCRGQNVAAQLRLLFMRKSATRKTFKSLDVYLESRIDECILC